MNKEITEIIVKVNDMSEYNKLYSDIKLNHDEFKYLNSISLYPNYIFIDFYSLNSVYFSNQLSSLNDKNVFDFIRTRRKYTYNKLFSINDINQILIILKNKTLQPTYNPKGKIIRTFENFKLCDGK